MILEKSFREKNTIETAYLSAMSQQTGKNWIGLIRSEYSYEIHLFCWFVEFTEQRGGMGVERKGMDGWMDGWTCGGNPSNQAWCLIQSMNESRTPNCRSEIFHIRMIWKEWITSWIYWAIVLRVMSVWQFIKAREHFRVPYINYNTISLQ